MAGCLLRRWRRKKPVPLILSVMRLEVGLSGQPYLAWRVRCKWSHYSSGDPI